jgi:hypothetical protein
MWRLFLPGMDICLLICVIMYIMSAQGLRRVLQRLPEAAGQGTGGGPRDGRDRAVLVSAAGGPPPN